jgi:hypothetical protein
MLNLSASISVIRRKIGFLASELNYPSFSPASPDAGLFVLKFPPELHWLRLPFSYSLSFPQFSHLEKRERRGSSEKCERDAHGNPHR